MQGFVIKTKAHGVSILCTECMATQVSPTAVEEHMPLNDRLERTVECYNCDVEIDGIEEEPKPSSWTVTVQVIVYAEPDEIVTEQDATDYVFDSVGSYFESVDITDVLTHF